MSLAHTSLAAFLAFAVCAGVLFALVAIPLGLVGPPRPVARQFLTNREHAMLVALEHVLPQCRIHAQVSMGALLEVPKRLGHRPKPSDRNGFAQKIVDFVVQDRATGRIVALIEVDGWSHDRDRDSLRDRMTGHAGYRTIRIPASVRPTIPGVLRAVGDLRPSFQPDTYSMEGMR